MGQRLGVRQDVGGVLRAGHGVRREKLAGVGRVRRRVCVVDNVVRVLQLFPGAAPAQGVRDARRGEGGKGNARVRRREGVGEERFLSRDSECIITRAKHTGNSTSPDSAVFSGFGRCFRHRHSFLFLAIGRGPDMIWLADWQ